MDKPVTSRSDPDSRRAYTRWHYRENKQVYIDRAKKKNDQVRAATRALIANHLRKHPCSDCGETDPIVLEFDHREGCKKRFNIGDAVRRRWPALSRRLQNATSGAPIAIDA